MCKTKQAIVFNTRHIVVNGQKWTVRDNMVLFTLTMCVGLCVCVYQTCIDNYSYSVTFDIGVMPADVLCISPATEITELAKSPLQLANVILCNQCRVNYSSFFQLAQQQFQLPVKFRVFLLFYFFIRNAYHQLDRKMSSVHNFCIKSFKLYFLGSFSRRFHR